MSSVSSYTKSTFLKSTIDAELTIHSGDCWFRGAMYFVDGVYDPDTIGTSQTIKLISVTDSETLVELPCGTEITMAQFMLPDEAYIAFPGGIKVGSDQAEIMEDLFLTVFYS